MHKKGEKVTNKDAIEILNKYSIFKTKGVEMRKNEIILALSISAGFLCVSSSALAKVDAAEAAKLGKE